MDFHEGGTMSEYASAPGVSPSLRGSGHGVWQREPGWQHYSLTFIFYRYDASGVFTGSQRARVALTLGASGDEFTANSAIEIRDANENVTITACGTPAVRGSVVSKPKTESIKRILRQSVPSLLLPDKR